MPKRAAFFILVATVISVSDVGAQHQHQPPTKDDQKKRAKVVTATIKNFLYNDGKPITIQVGDSIVWLNDDSMPHSATGSEFDTGILKPGEKSEPIVFLRESGVSGFSYSCVVHERMNGTVIVINPIEPDPRETPSTHSMVVSGLDSSSIFLHHIALFSDLNHYYHVTLEGKLTEPGAQKAYQEFRAKSGDSLCILDPENFLLPEIRTGKRTSFKATFFRGTWQEKITGLQDVTVSIVRIIQFRSYDPQDHYPNRLTYQLFGNDKEVFLAHQVTEEPNFQEVVKIKDRPPFLTSDLVKSSPIVILPTKQIASAGLRTFKTAVLNNSTHVIMSPPARTLNPTEPLEEDEEIEILVPGDASTHKIRIGKTIYFDVRILNK